MVLYFDNTTSISFNIRTQKNMFKTSMLKLIMLALMFLMPASSMTCPSTAQNSTAITSQLDTKLKNYSLYFIKIALVYLYYLKSEFKDSKHLHYFIDIVVSNLLHLHILTQPFLDIQQIVCTLCITYSQFRK